MVRSAARFVYVLNGAFVLFFLVLPYEAHCQMSFLGRDRHMDADTVNYALQFDGNDEAVIPHSNSLSFSENSQFTMELWFMPSGSKPTYHILGKRAVCGHSQLNYQLARDPNSVLHFISDFEAVSVGVDPPVNVWTHMSVTYKNNFLSIYINGVLQVSTPYSVVGENTVPLRLGNTGTCPVNMRFLGLIDEVRFWNVARSAEEIACTFNRIISSTTPGLVGYWRFDEDTGEQTIFDLSGEGNHGTLGADSTTGNDDPIRVSSTAPLVELFHDAHVVRIVEPRKIVVLQSTITPQVIVRNLGVQTDTIPVNLQIGSNYNENATVVLAEGDSGAVSFPSWIADTVGVFQIQCASSLPSDSCTYNDSLASVVAVVADTTGPTIFGVSPDHGGNAGTVSVTIGGYGFESGIESKLARSGYQDIIPFAVTFVDSSTVIATFDLSGRQLGNWDVTVTNPGGKSFTFSDGFTIEAETTNLWAEIVGRLQLRVGREATYLVRFGNSGNVDVGTAWILLWIPSGVDYRVTYGVEEIVSNTSAVVSDTLWTLLPIVATDVSAGISGEFSLHLTPPFGLEEGQIGISITDDPASILPDYFEWADSQLDSTLIVPNGIPADEKVTPAIMESISSLTRHDGSPAQCGDIIYVSPTPVQAPPDQRWGGEHVLIHLGDDKAGHHFFDLAQEIPISSIDSVLHSGHEFRIKWIYPPPHNVDCSTIRERWSTFKRINPCYHPKAPKDSGCKSCLFPLLYSWYGHNGQIQPELDANKDGGYDTAEVANYLRKQYPTGEISVGWTIPAIPGWFLRIWNDFFAFTTVTSWDPNEKTGPKGFGSSHAISLNQSLSYFVYFENVDSATAAAQEIEILDTLSSNLDWNTLDFGNLQVADTTIVLIHPGQTFTKVVSWNDSTNLQIDGTFNLSNGVIRWYLQGIDIASGGLADFLPPNKNPPEGEGWVSFNVDSRSDLLSGSQIENRAAIIFDVNPQIMTNQVLNTIDAEAPMSLVESVNDSTPDAEFVISWSGVDDSGGSQIRNYSIYVAEDGGAFSPWLSQETDTDGIYPGRRDHTYWFYSIAKDSVGNLEPQPEIPDLVVWNAGYDFQYIGWQLSAISNQPSNPTVSNLFPTSLASYTWDPTIEEYISVDTWDTADGYWLAILPADRFWIGASPIYEDTAQ